MADKDKKKGGKDAQTEAKAGKKAEPKAIVLPPLELAVSLIRLAAAENEARFVVRALRKLTAIRCDSRPAAADFFFSFRPFFELGVPSHARRVCRSSVSGAALRQAALKELGPKDDTSFVALLPEDDGGVKPMETEEDKPAAAVAGAASTVPAGPCIELETFFHLFTVVRLLDDGRREEAAACATALVEKVKSFVRPTLTPIAAKAFFYLSRAVELLGGERYAALRSVLLNAHITAALQHANEAQLTILNLLLRNFLQHSLYDQADKLSAKSSRVAGMLADGSVSNNQIARYLHYQGRIQAVQLAYPTAFEYLEESLRKAPKDGAIGFRLATYKLLTIVQLLMGEIPDRSVFFQPGLARELLPYFFLARAVRLGDLEAYNKAVAAHTAQFARDETHALVVRLRHNVIKTGLHKINSAYSRISFADICEKLRLDSPKDAEYIVAKAIRDGALEATIEHGQYMQSKPTVNTYATGEPYAQFHKRVEFCIQIRNDAVKAMRFPETQEAADVLKDNEEKKVVDATADVDESAALDELDEED